MSLDPVIHPVNRLRICAALHNAGAVSRGRAGREMRFAELRDQLALTDATLSKQLSALESHGYVTRSRDWLHPRAGRRLGGADGGGGGGVVRSSGGAARDRGYVGSGSAGYSSSSSVTTSPPA